MWQVPSSVGKPALELFELEIAGLGRQALVDHLMCARDVTGAKRGVGQLQMERRAWPRFVDRAIEPADRERRLAQPHRVVGNLRGYGRHGFLVADERRVFQQRITSLLDPPVAPGDLGQPQIRIGRKREFGNGLAECALRSLALI